MVAITHLKSLQALESALRAGSFKAAADRLGITPAAVGQRIKTLEDYLGVDLLVRGRSGLRPTPELDQALPHLSEAFNALTRVSDILDFQRTNEIHIAANSDFIELWLAPRLPEFRARHPNTLFCLNGEGDIPMRLGAADIEIRFSAPRDDADCLFHDALTPISSPENISRTDRANIPDIRNRLSGFPLLHLDFYKDDPVAPDWPKWIDANNFNRDHPAIGVRYQRLAPAIDAIIASAGYMICGLALLRPQLEANAVAPAFPTIAPTRTTHTYNARFRADALNRPQVQRFRSWLLEEANGTAAWLANQAH